MVALTRDRRQRSASRLPVALVRVSARLLVDASFVDAALQKPQQHLASMLAYALDSVAPEDARSFAFAHAAFAGALATYDCDVRRQSAAAFIAQSARLLAWADRAERAAGKGL